MLPEPFQTATAILREIEQHHHQAFFVGGCVRDFLLKRPIGDIDIATSATPDLIQRIFEKVIPVGIEHGTVVVRYKKESYEVTTFRIDGTYSDSRHPDHVEFIDQLDKDLERRDFTINALAMDKSGAIIDLFASRADLQHKLIRTVGNGFDRFTEDPLRIIRALRFSSELGFQIDKETLFYMKKVKEAINNLAVERITTELGKFFAGKYVNNGITYLKDTEAYKHIPVFTKYPQIISLLPTHLKPLYSLGEVLALLHLLEPTVTVKEWVKEWKCSNQIKQEALQLVEACNHYKSNGINDWLVYQLSPAYYQGFIRLINTLFLKKQVSLQELISRMNNLPITSRTDIVIKGNDLIDLYPHAKRGPWLQQTITSIEKEIVAGNLKNDNYNIKEWIKCNPPEIN
ncbi:CCA tRNA nucleotidyltransferase [Virgibacillus tibetensis]